MSRSSLFSKILATALFAPADFKKMLDFLGYVIQTNDYPKSK